MSRILLLIDEPDHRERLCEFLTADYELVMSDTPQNYLPTSFDLAVIDESALEHLAATLQATKQADSAVFLPILLVVSGSDTDSSHYLAHTVNEIIYQPVREAELKARVKLLLQTRHLSLQLHQTSQLLQHEIVHHQQLEADQAHAVAVERFLAEASKVLATILDYKAGLAALAPLLLPMLGDGCFIDVIEPDGNMKRMAAAHVIPAKDDLVRRLQEYPPDLNPDGIIMQTAKTGQTIIAPPVPLAVLQTVILDPTQFQVLKELELGWIMVVPLKARGRTLGVISFARTDPDSPYTAADQSLAEELAHRAALAIDNTRLYNEAQQAIRRKDESLALLDTLLMTAPIGLAFLDRDFRFARINQALAQINGQPAAAHLGKPLLEVLPTVGVSQLPLLQQVLDTDEPLVNLEGSRRSQDSSSVPLHWLASYYPVRTQAGETLGVGVVVVDVTARKQAEEAQSFLVEASTLLSSSLDYQVTLQNLTRLAVSALADWCVIDVVEENAGFQRLAAAHADPTKDLLVQQLRAYPPAPHEPSSVSEVVQSAKSLLVPKMSEDMHIAVAQNPEHLALLQALGATSVMVVPLMARGRILGAISLVKTNPGRSYGAGDLILAEELAWRAALAIDNAKLYQTAQRAIEAQTELDRLKDRFLSIASHELRTPLTSIKGYTQILKRELLKKQAVGAFEREYRLVDSLLHQSDRMAELISEMLDISRLHSGQLELRYNAEADLVALVQRIVLEQQDTTTHHTLILRTEGAAIVGSVDEARLEQVLHNLISNAIKYSPPNTQVEIEVTLPTPSEIQVAVRDYGYGISPEQQVHIFDQFYRARHSNHPQIDGLGLGLFISKEIVARHGGQMWVESSLDQGSTFYFSLPLAKTS